MSRPAKAMCVAVALAAYVGPLAGEAVAQAPTDAELIQRVEALLPGYEAARAARNEQRLRVQEEEEQYASVRVDTVQIGPMRLVSLPEDIQAARELFTEVWQGDFSHTSESPSLRATTFVVQWRARLRRFEVEQRPGEQVVRVDIARAWAPTREHARQFVADAIARALIGDFPTGSPVRAWLTAQSHPADEAVYRALASETLKASRDCLAGNARACQASLGFGFSASADRLALWFSAEARQQMVSDAGDGGRVDRESDSYRRCVEENDARSCDPILAELDWVTSPPPTSDRSRAHLLWFAARQGGEGAWQRALQANGAPIPEALASISGQSVEQLVADWRAHVVAQRPDVQAGLGGRGTRALLWSLVFVAFAMRSTRWRLA